MRGYRAAFGGHSEYKRPVHSVKDCGTGIFKLLSDRGRRQHGPAAAEAGPHLGLGQARGGRGRHDYRGPGRRSTVSPGAESETERRVLRHREIRGAQRAGLSAADAQGHGRQRRRLDGHGVRHRRRRGHHHPPGDGRAARGIAPAHRFKIRRQRHRCARRPDHLHHPGDQHRHGCGGEYRNGRCHEPLHGAAHRL